MLRTLVCALERHGMRVFPASSSREALVLARTHHATIDVMVCDVLMPDGNGPETADRVLAVHPETRVLFIAGYPEHPLVVHRVLDPGLPFLPKPFLPRELLQKIRQLVNVSSFRAAGA